MKVIQLFFLLLVTVYLYSCKPRNPLEEESSVEHQAEEEIHKIPEGDFEILEIDGCQYIVYKEVDGANKAFGYMAHKGNCTNPIHHYNISDDKPLTIDTLQSMPES